MAEPSRRFRIGYALAPKKQHSFIQPSLVNLAKDRGIDLIKIDAYTPLIDQGPFDCVIHKMYGDDWTKQLDDFSAKNPSARVFDRPESISKLHNRITMLQVVSDLKIELGHEDFDIPKQIVAYDDEMLCGISNSSEGLKFPVIAKPLVADGSAKSHDMSLVYNQESLNKLKSPIVLQEFVNHGGVIFKVYVVGDFVKCVKRKSLPDVAEEKLGCSEGLMSFSQVSNLNNEERNDDEYYKMMDLEDTEMPPLKLVTEIARGLRRAMKLNLFNFDVIRDSRFGNRYLVIDINYFPGYAKMPSYESALTDFFWDIVHHEDNSVSMNVDGNHNGDFDTKDNTLS